MQDNLISQTLITSATAFFKVRSRSQVPRGHVFRRAPVNTDCWASTPEFTFPTSSQVMLMLLVQWPQFEDHCLWQKLHIPVIWCLELTSVRCLHGIELWKMAEFLPLSFIFAHLISPCLDSPVTPINLQEAIRPTIQKGGVELSQTWLCILPAIWVWINRFIFLTPPFPPL